MSSTSLFLTTTDGITLEALATPPADPPRGGALILHPHPLYGGDLHNHVVTALAREAAARGMLALRLNFRGVGRSTGRHDGGRAEVADALAGLAWLREQGVGPLVLMGYSFGALVAAQTALQAGDLAAGFWVSPAVVLETPPPWPGPGPLHILSGTLDEFAPPRALAAYADGCPACHLELVEGLDHFWQGSGATLAAWLDQLPRALGA
ncbi:MAG: alpha/beta hydrolase [Deltaproteobacteria bacterium]|nr:alpha/beta hydrolase [Deltaproteobacteria bacterium]